MFSPIKLILSKSCSSNSIKPHSVQQNIQNFKDS